MVTFERTHVALMVGVGLLFALPFLQFSEADYHSPSTSEGDALRFQGQPFFPLGIYDDKGLLGTPAGILWEEVEQAGFNLVHYSSLAVAESQTEPPGILRSVQIDRKEFFNPHLPSYLHDRATDNQLFWEFIDEPIWNGFRCDDADFIDQFPGLLALQRKSAGTEPLLWINFVSSRVFPTGRVSGEQQRRCAENIAADVVSSDYYPFYGGNNTEPTTMQQVLHDAELLTEAISPPGGQSMVVLQGFGSYIEPCGNLPCPLTPGRFPTRTETRFMAYGAIVKGAKGIMWWGLTSSLALYENDIAAWREALWEHRYRDSIVPVVQELRSPDIYAALVGRNRIHPPASAPIITLQTEDDAAWYLIAVNNSGTSQLQKELHTTAFPGSPVTVVRENRYLTLTAARTLTDDFAPWEVHVYKITKPKTN